MAAATAPVLDPPSSPPAAPAAATGGGAKALFAFKALRDGRTVMELSAFEGDAEEIRVEAEIYSVRAGDDEKGQRRSLVFPTGEQARKFADEALITFEYMGCTIKDLVSGSQSARSQPAPAIAA
jgi:hypothetical protein